MVTKGDLKMVSGSFLKKNYGVLPVIGIVGFVCALAPVYTVYMVWSKPDISLKIPGLLEPGEQPMHSVDPLHHSKLINKYPEKYVRDEKIQRLRQEVGSYKPK